MENTSITAMIERVHAINKDMLKEFDRLCKSHDAVYFLAFGGLLGAVRHQDFIPWDNDVDVLMTYAEYEKIRPFLKTDIDQTKYEGVYPEDFGKKYMDIVPRLFYRHATIRMDGSYVAYYDGIPNRIGLDIFLMDRFPSGFLGKVFFFRIALRYALLNGKRDRISIEHYPAVMKPIGWLLGHIGRCFNTEKLRKKTEKITRKYENRTDIHTYRVINDNMTNLAREIPESYIASTVEVPLGEDHFPAPVEKEKLLTLWFNDYMTLPPENERIFYMGNVPAKPEDYVFTED